MASFDAAAAEFAGKALGTFWTLFFAASVAADLDLLPGVSARLRLFAARGKQADAVPSSPSAPAHPARGVEVVGSARLVRALLRRRHRVQRVRARARAGCRAHLGGTRGRDARVVPLPSARRAAFPGDGVRREAPRGRAHAPRGLPGRRFLLRRRAGDARDARNETRGVRDRSRRAREGARGGDAREVCLRERRRRGADAFHVGAARFVAFRRRVSRHPGSGHRFDPRSAPRARSRARWQARPCPLRASRASPRAPPPSRSGPGEASAVPPTSGAAARDAASDGDDAGDAREDRSRTRLSFGTKLRRFDNSRRDVGRLHTRTKRTTPCLAATGSRWSRRRTTWRSAFCTRGWRSSPARARFRDWRPCWRRWAPTSRSRRGGRTRGTSRRSRVPEEQVGHGPGVL